MAQSVSSKESVSCFSTVPLSLPRVDTYVLILLNSFSVSRVAPVAGSTRPPGRRLLLLLSQHLRNPAFLSVTRMDAISMQPRTTKSDAHKTCVRALGMASSSCGSSGTQDVPFPLHTPQASTEPTQTCTGTVPRSSIWSGRRGLREEAFVAPSPDVRFNAEGQGAPQFGGASPI